MSDQEASEVEFLHFDGINLSQNGSEAAHEQYPKSVELMIDENWKETLF